MSTRTGPVVVGVDGSPDGTRAIDYGAWAATWRGVPLRLVYGYQPAPLWGPAVILAGDYAWVVDWARDMLSQAVQRVRVSHPGLEVSCAVIAGSPAAVLIDESRVATLVVVGSRGLGGVSGMLAGSVSTQVAAHAHAPIVVLRPPSTHEPGSNLAAVADLAQAPVLVGVDGSAGSIAALQFALDEAAARDVELHAVYAWDVPPTHNLGPITPTHFDLDEAQQEADRMLAEVLAGWQEKYPQVRVQRRAVHSYNPIRTLIEAGESASMIVVGPRGHGGFTGLLLGSVADALVRHGNRPVAVVHPSDQTSH